MADEVRSREWLGEEESVRNSSSKRVGRNQRGYYAEELGIDNETEKSREMRKRDNKDRKKERREEKNYEGKDKERFKHWEKEDVSGKEIVKHGSRERMGGSRDKRKENQDDYGKLKDELELDKEKVRDKIRDRDFDRIKHREDKDNEKAKDRLKEHDMAKDIDHDRDRSIDKEFEHSRGHGKDGGREAKSRVKERDKDKHTDHGRERSIERERDQNHDYVKDKTKDGEKDKGKRKHREKEVDVVADQDKSKGRDRGRDIDRDKEVSAEENLFIKRMADISEGDAPNKILFDGHSKAVGWQTSTELKERLKKMREDRINGTSVAGLTSKEILEEDSGILSWVSKSRKLEQERNAEKEKAMALSRMLDEQDRILDESEDEFTVDSSKDLAGIKVIHGLDKVMEGSTIVLTLKDQNILADGDINEDIDMLESVEIGEQKRRDKAYLDAKRNTGKYDDKFNEDLIFEKTVLPQYNDSIDDEGVTLDESGGFTGEAEKKLAELRKRIEGNYLKKDYVDLSLSGKIQSDYFTTDEMLQFKKPKKKKSLRKKAKLDLDALEAEARAAGLGVGDLGTRDDTKRQSAREEEEKSLAKARSNAYQTALAKAEEASKILRQEQALTSKVAHYDNPVFGEDYDDLQKSIEQARKLSLKKPDEAAFFGPQAVALLATAYKEQNDVQGSALGDTKGNKVVITEMEEFVLGLQINEETTNLVSGDVFKDEEVVPKLIGHEPKADNGGWTEAKETEMVELSISGESGDVTPDEIIHETAVGKGLASALKLLKNRGTLKESIDWGGRNMDKKKSKLVGIDANDGSKEIRIERTDEFGRIMTPKEAFRMISHRFHGKGPGKMKQEKRMKQYQEDLKTKQMKASDTPLLAMEKMREAQSRLKMPYLVLSGHVKPGQSSDPTSGFATVEKDNPGSLTPMLGDKKVEHFLGIRSKPDSGRMGPPPPKKPKI